MNCINRYLLAIAVGLVVSGCARETSGDVANNVFGDDGNLGRFLQSGSCTAHRIDPRSVDDQSVWGASPSEYQRIGTPVDLSDAQLESLKKLLTTSRSYYLGAAKECMPEPGLLLKFSDANGESLDLLVFYQCKMLAFFSEDNLIGREDFDPARKKMVKLAKEPFPSDADIQSL